MFNGHSGNSKVKGFRCTVVYYSDNNRESAKVSNNRITWYSGNSGGRDVGGTGRCKRERENDGVKYVHSTLNK